MKGVKGTKIMITATTRRRLLAGITGLATALMMSNQGSLAQPVTTPKTISAGKLTMSINPTLPPLQFVDEQGQLQGMRVELGNAIAEKLGLTPEYVRIEFAAMVPGLAARRWDMINTGIYWTEERSELMYMVPYELAAVSFMAPRGNPLGISTWQDLAGLSVGVELGGIEETRTREVNQMLIAEGLEGITIRTFNNFSEAFQALRAGQVEAATAIDATAMYWQERGTFTRAVSGLFPQVATFAFADRDLAESVAQALNELREDGYYDDLFERYGVLPIEEDEFAIRGPGPA
ncbi:ABC transporter substrate-binding protein [Devosia sp. 1566]|uniref:ABC transporter substrate-binding protein n=1 Tax=Devosia sp. 1566 TaxID=2499144 RepID=UPI0020BEF9E0|nr:ABC transporter substrate-binding protein [Devosia sp. 1566]